MADNADAPNKTKPNDYISNPFDLFQPSVAAINLNLGTFVTLIFTVIGSFVAAGLLYALIVLSGLTNATANVVLFFAVAAAVLYVVFTLLPAITLVLLHGARGHKVTFGEVTRQGRPFAMRMLLLTLLTVLAIVGGILLFIIPAFIFAAWFSLASYVMVDEDLGAIEAMKRSKQLVSGRVVEMWGVLGLGQAFSLLSIIPILGFIAGVILSVMYAASSAIRYDQLKAGAGEVNVHWLNYVAIVLALIALGVSTSQSMSESKKRDAGTAPTYDFFR